MFYLVETLFQLHPKVVEQLCRLGRRQVGLVLGQQPGQNFFGQALCRCASGSHAALIVCARQEATIEMSVAHSFC